MAEANEVAEWMASEVEVWGFLYQDSAVAQIADKFGDEFIERNEDGTASISETVLTAFGALTDGAVIWDRWDKAWRQRQPDDPGGKLSE
jgi:hypothetical protein